MAGGNGQGRSDDFLSDVLRGIGAPVNAATLAFMRAWARYESGTPSNNPDSASWNPLNTTLNAKGATPFNSVGVRNYQSREQGLSATIATLNSKRGYYDGILKALRRGNGEAAMKALVASPWSGTHYGARKLRGGGWDYRNTNIYKTYQSVLSRTGVDPVAVQSDGSSTAYADPIRNTIVWVKPDGTPVIFKPMALFYTSSLISGEERRRIKVVTDPARVGAYLTGNYQSGIGLDEGGVIGLSGIGIPGPLDAVTGLSGFDPLGPLAWVFDNRARIGIGALGVLLLLLGVGISRYGSVKETIGVVANVMPQGKVAGAVARAA